VAAGGPGSRFRLIHKSILINDLRKKSATVPSSVCAKWANWCATCYRRKAIVTLDCDPRHSERRTKTYGFFFDAEVIYLGGLG
jgi:hypothetical protein